ncbi:MAG TPA: N-acetylmuramoyl-L-alanine amidase [Verrucomicrobiae bacterium]|jgi:N-acetylmuramoyl-L-alanine amidase
MKLAITVLALVGSLSAAWAQSALSKLPRVEVFGREYVRLEDWAAANGCQMKWLVKGQDVQLISRSSTLAFTADSRRMTLNGVALWLSVPVAVRNASALIAPVDLSSAIYPVLFPPRNAGGARVTTICLDPGHGGKDPGKLDGRQQEKKYTLLLAQEVKEHLIKAGLKVKLTRSSDSFVELPTRPELARLAKADLFVSLHFNAADGNGSGVAKGVETYCLTPPRQSSTNARGEGAGAGAFPGNFYDRKNTLLAYQMQKALAKELPVEDRGVKRARLAVLRDAQMPAVLIEGGFMSHPVEAKKIYDPAFRRQMAQAIVNGVIAYKKLVEQ